MTFLSRKLIGAEGYETIGGASLLIFLSWTAGAVRLKRGED